MKREKFWTCANWRLFFSWDVQRRILVTLLGILAFKLGALVAIPEVDASVLVQAVQDNPIFSLMTMMGGGGIEQFSIFSLGIGPYITAQIIIQLLSMDVVQKFSELSKQGQRGRAQLNQYTKYLALLLSVIQGLGMAYSFSIMYPGFFPESFTLASAVYIGILFSAGTMILLTLGNLMTKFGIGNGISILIATGIISRMPSEFYSAWLMLWESGEEAGKIAFGLFVMAFVIIILFIYLLATSEFKIPVHYTSSTESRVHNYLPLKLNSSGVMPVIFASTILSLPVQFVGIFANGNEALDSFVKTWCGMGTWQSLAVYGLLIVVFAYFYTSLQINPEELAENLAKSGAYIPDVRPGATTEKYLKKRLYRLTGIGCVALLCIALLPNVLPLIFPELPASLPVGGTGMIIVVSVVIELYQQVKGIIMQKSYSSCTVNKKVRGWCGRERKAAKEVAA